MTEFEESVKRLKTFAKDDVETYRNYYSRAEVIAPLLQDLAKVVLHNYEAIENMTKSQIDELKSKLKMIETQSPIPTVIYQPVVPQGDPQSSAIPNYPYSRP